MSVIKQKCKEEIELEEWTQGDEAYLVKLEMDGAFSHELLVDGYHFLDDILYCPGRLLEIFIKNMLDQWQLYREHKALFILAKKFRLVITDFEEFKNTCSSECNAFTIDLAFDPYKLNLGFYEIIYRTV